MTQVLVAQQANFGALASEAVAELLDAKAKLDRVSAAIVAAGGYNAGTPTGSVFEIAAETSVTNNYGVVANASSAGTNGSAWAYAAANLAAALDTFMTANAGGIQTIDQGVVL